MPQHLKDSIVVYHKIVNVGQNKIMESQEG